MGFLSPWRQMVGALFSGHLGAVLRECYMLTRPVPITHRTPRAVRGPVRRVTFFYFCFFFFFSDSFSF
jgi:hypothetical protein